MTEEVTMKNTKKEMWDLIEELKSEIKNKEKDNLNPEKIKEEAKNTAIIEHSDKAVESALTTQIHQLKVSINKELTFLSDKLEAEAETYENLKKAIDLKESELHEIYGIEKATTELVTILEAQKKARAEFQSEMSEKQACLENELKEKKAQLEHEIKEISEKWEKEKLDRQFLEKETKANLEKERKRENEEYEYQLTRKRQLEENKITDELEELEKVQILKRDAFEQKYQEKTIILNEREKNISERELKMQDLQAKQIDKLNLQQEKAYEKIQDIANKAVSGASERLQNITVRTAADKQS